jgi:hypothetical protein
MISAKAKEASFAITLSFIGNLATYFLKKTGTNLESA